MNKHVTIVLISLFLLSCGKDEVVTDVDAEVVAWLEAASITTAVRDDNGIYFYSELENLAGQGINAGNVVAIYYSLFDLDGNQVASHQRTDGDSLLFKQGVGAVYPVGLDAGVINMRSGEIYSFILPPDQAFEGLTSGAVASGRIYRLQVQVVGVFDEAAVFAQEAAAINNYILANSLNDTITNPLDSVELHSNGVAYKRLSAGTSSLPSPGDTIRIDFSRNFINGNTGSESQNGFSWVVGSASPNQLIPGFEFGVSLMQVSEEALFLIPSAQAYRESALVIPSFIVNDLIVDEIIPDYVAKVPPYHTLLFNVTRVE